MAEQQEDKRNAPFVPNQHSSVTSAIFGASENFQAGTINDSEKHNRPLNNLRDPNSAATRADQQAEELRRHQLANVANQDSSKKQDAPEVDESAAKEPSLKENIEKFESYFKYGGLRTDKDITQSLKELATLTETIQKQLQESPNLDAETKQALGGFKQQAEAVVNYIPLYKNATRMLRGDNAEANDPQIASLNRIQNALGSSLKAINTNEQAANTDKSEAVSEDPFAQAEAAQSDPFAEAETKVDDPLVETGANTEAGNETGNNSSADQGASETSGEPGAGTDQAEADQEQSRALGGQEPEKEIAEEQQASLDKEIERVAVQRGLDRQTTQELKEQVVGSGLSQQSSQAGVQIAAQQTVGQAITQQNITQAQRDIEAGQATNLKKQGVKVPDGVNPETLAAALGAVGGMKLGGSLGIADVAVQSHGTDHSTSLTHSAGGGVAQEHSAGLSSGGTQLS